MGRDVDSRHQRQWTDTPRVWFLVVAVILLIIGLIGLVRFATPNGVETGQKFVPPTMVDGEIVPGHFE